MTTTVKMSLGEYERLKSFEIAIEEMENNGSTIIHFSMYGRIIVKSQDKANVQLLQDLKCAIEMRDDACQRMNQMQTQLREITEKYNSLWIKI